ncbi:MAG: ABC transporter permease [Verrucomicrobia bacterium]|nr:ABC transporter permease [Verrucomicrobiota bacterium]
MANSDTAQTPLSEHCIVIVPTKGWKLIAWQELIEYRDLLYFLVLRDVTVLYKQTIFGFAWALMNPVFSMLVFTVIFGALGKLSTDGQPKSVFYYAGVLPWTYFQGAMSASANSLISGANIFSKVYFPRLFIPLVPIISKLLDFGIAFLLMIVMMVWYRIMPTTNLVFLPLLVLLLILTAAGMGMWLSALSIQYRDVRYAVAFCVQLLMYAAPVVWTATSVPEKYRLIYGIYPLAGIIDGFRVAILGGRPMPWDLIAVGSVSAVVIFLTGAFYYRRTERIFVDVA